MKDASNLFNEMFPNEILCGVSSVQTILDWYKNLHCIKNAGDNHYTKIT